MKTTFIYALNCPETGECRYVGKADNPRKRFDEHLRAEEKYHSARWIRSLIAKNRKPRLEILDEVPYLEWEFWEKEYIRVFLALGFALTNETAGGDGVQMTPEIREKIGASLKGKKRTPETRAKISASRLGKKTKYNTSGFAGVSYAQGKWRVKLHVKNLGTFQKIEDAVFVYALALALDKHYANNR